MDGLTVFGFIAIMTCVICDRGETKNKWFTLVFAVACVASAIYAFLQGAYPFVLAETIWAVSKFHQFFFVRQQTR